MQEKKHTAAGDSNKAESSKAPSTAKTRSTSKSRSTNKKPSTSKNPSTSENPQGNKIVMKKKKIPKSKNDQENRVRAFKEKRGVVYIGRVPKGFFEPQMRTFFEQFGKVTRVRLSRNSKTTHSRGYGWVEFELAEIADIVAKTMNGYYLDGRSMQVHVVSEDKNHGNFFKSAGKRKFPKVVALRKKEMQRHNKQTSTLPKGTVIASGKKVISVRQKKRAVKAKQKTKQRLLAKGINYDPASFATA